MTLTYFYHETEYHQNFLKKGLILKKYSILTVCGLKLSGSVFLELIITYLGLKATASLKGL